MTFFQYLNKCSKLCHVTLRVIKHSKQSKLNQKFMKPDIRVNACSKAFILFVVIDWQLWLAQIWMQESHTLPEKHFLLWMKRFYVMINHWRTLRYFKSIKTVIHTNNVFCYYVSFSFLCQITIIVKLIKLPLKT